VPVLVHTGLGTPFSLPSLVIDAARRYPDVTFILCHAGFAVYTDEAIVAAKYCDNIVLEPSWCQTYTVAKMIKTIGAERIVMGSDHLTNLPVELVKFRSIGLSDNELELILYTNAKRIFQLDV
jgi:predicted TIM-barrel fold metal-dependent hydrolase